MAIKQLIAAGLAAVTLIFVPASQADAKTNVNIGIGIGSPAWIDGCYTRHGYWCGYRPYPYHFYHLPRHRPVYFYYHDYDDYPPVIVRPGHRMSCRAAARLVDRSGFNAVRTRECRGKIFTFHARKKGHNYVVRVNAQTRRIVAASRI